MTQRRSVRRLSIGLVLALGGAACGEPEGSAADFVAIHLEEELDVARVEGGSVRAGAVKELRWSFEEGLGEWSALPNLLEGGEPVGLGEVDGAVEVRVTDACLAPGVADERAGGIQLDVSDFDLSAWSEVVVRVRATGPTSWLGIGYNVRNVAGKSEDEEWPTVFWGAGAGHPASAEFIDLRFPVDGEGGPITRPVEQIAILFGTSGEATIEIASVALVPTAAVYAESGVGVRSISSSAHEDFGPQRRTLYAHTPSRLTYDITVPACGRLDLALGAYGAGARMSVRVDDGRGEEALLDEAVAASAPWQQRSVDLARFAGKAVSLSLVAEPAEEDAPAIAFWASPTLSSTKAKPTRPSVVFYVIDGASAGYMSVYGYERETTPNMEKLAAEGVVFENAYSNATWTMPSTASFMTSLHHSVIGGLRNDINPIPRNATTMAEHFHGAGFHTGVFTFNPNAGSRSGLERGVDVFRDFGKRGDPFDPIEAISSKVLHAQFWDWRDAYPGPYWVHFQTTDVHPPHHPPSPFAGRLQPADESEALAKQIKSFRFPFNHRSASVHEHWQGQLEANDVDPLPFYEKMLAAHDEAMMHQDMRLGELVEELKARGEWENTLLVIGSDHGHPAASYPRFGRGLLDPQPPAWAGALLGEYESRVPLIVVWPGRIEGGRRFEEPVSMIDVLPTILELAELPAPELVQGSSLASVLLGEGEWNPPPVLFDEFRVEDDGSMIGNLEMVEGRWGHSLEIRTIDAASTPALGRHPAPAGGRWSAQDFPEVARFQLYDLEADPLALRNVAADHPERAAEAQRRLWQIWEAHQALATRFEEGAQPELSPEQEEALRALGYTE